MGNHCGGTVCTLCQHWEIETYANVEWLVEQRRWFHQNRQMNGLFLGNAAVNIVGIHIDNKELLKDSYCVMTNTPSNVSKCN